MALPQNRRYSRGDTCRGLIEHMMPPALLHIHGWPGDT
jgi:hypothetical protein